MLRAARAGRGLSLRDVERRTGIRNAHLSQIETDTIAKPEMAILWDLAALYGVDFARLLALAGHVSGARDEQQPAPADDGRAAGAGRAVARASRRRRCGSWPS